MPSIKLNRFPVVILMIALAVRVIFILVFGNENRLYDSLFDQTIYIDVANNLAQGNGFVLSFSVFVADVGPTSIVPPIYPLFLAATFSLSEGHYLFVRIVQAVISALTCVLIYFISRNVVGEVASKVAAVISCFYLPLIMYTRPLMTETLFIFLLALAIFQTLRLLNKLSLINALFAGICWGLSALTRPETAFYMGAVAFYGIVVLWRNYKEQFLQLSVYLVLTLLATVIVYSPWVIRNWSLYGHFVPTSTQSWTFWEMNYLRYYRDIEPKRYPEDLAPERIDVPNFNELNELQRDQALFRLASDFIKEHPAQFIYFGLTRVFASYPIIPRETEFLPDSQEDMLATDALDDFPEYNTFAEGIRVWSFRAVFISAVLAILVAVRQQKYESLLFILLIISNISGAALVRGKERARILVDPYIIIMGAQFLVMLYYLSYRFIKRTASLKS